MPRDRKPWLDHAPPVKKRNRPWRLTRKNALRAAELTASSSDDIGRDNKRVWWVDRD
jgi:hypothetical protein